MGYQLLLPLVYFQAIFLIVTAIIALFNDCDACLLLFIMSFDNINVLLLQC